jgi:hypothetical protein
MPAFSTAKLAGLQLKAENIWRDSMQNASYVAEVQGLTAIRANQTATITPLTDKNKNYKVRVNWLDKSTITASDLGVNAGNNCDLDEPLLDAAGKEYKLDTFLKSGFSVNEDQMQDGIYSKEEAIAGGLLAAMKNLDELVSVKMMAKTDSYAGKNRYLGPYTESNGQTQVGRANYNAQFFAYLAQASIVNRMRSNFLIDNGSLFQAKFIADASAGDANGKGTAALFNTKNIYFDLFNMSGAGLTTDTLMINRGALAFTFKSRFTPQPRELTGKVNQTRYSVESPNLPGVTYDVYYTMKCTVNTDEESDRFGEDEIVHIWRFVFRGGLFLNPEGVGTGNTGVLAFNVS